MALKYKMHRNKENCSVTLPAGDGVSVLRKIVENFLKGTQNEMLLVHYADPHYYRQGQLLLCEGGQCKPIYDAGEAAKTIILKDLQFLPDLPSDMPRPTTYVRELGGIKFIIEEIELPSRVNPGLVLVRQTINGMDGVPYQAFLLRKMKSL